MSSYGNLPEDLQLAICQASIKGDSPSLVRLTAHFTRTNLYQWDGKVESVPRRHALPANWKMESSGDALRSVYDHPVNGVRSNIHLRLSNF